MRLELAALLFSALALWASWRANSIAQKALNESSKVKLLEIQSEILREVDLQHAKFSSLLAITAEAALLYTQNPSLAVNNPGGFERIKENIHAVQSLRECYEKQRNLAESNVGKGSIEAETKILANIRRLTLHVQEDLDKELRHVEVLREQARIAQPGAKPTAPPMAGPRLSWCAEKNCPLNHHFLNTNTPFEDSIEFARSYKMTGRHTFSFEGGEQLTTIGATFFVSYLYFQHVDKTHLNWDSIKTKNSRISTINRSGQHHRAWLERINDMNDANLNKNSLCLSGAKVKEMARAVLQAL